MEVVIESNVLYSDPKSSRSVLLIEVVYWIMSIQFCHVLAMNAPFSIRSCDPHQEPFLELIHVPLAVSCQVVA